MCRLHREDIQMSMRCWNFFTFFCRMWVTFKINLFLSLAVFSISSQSFQGSPPHTWGIPAKIKHHDCSLGITPTYMGNTQPFGLRPDHQKDHPHIHGEYQLLAVRFRHAVGSPTHTWGILYGLVSLVAVMRITPTYMGNTFNNWAKLPRVQDHPHIHGEYSVLPNTSLVTEGSPPHTWGIPSR